MTAPGFAFSKVMCEVCEVTVSFWVCFQLLVVYYKVFTVCVPATGESKAERTEWSHPEVERAA